MTRDAPAVPVELIYAVAENGVIGSDGGMPWRLPSDLARFKQRTMGTPVVMGRRTFESIGRALPGRRCIVVTRQADYAAPGCEVVASPEEAIARARDEPGARAVSVIGGAEIYRQLMPIADRLVVTHVEAAPEGDTRMPAIDRDVWRLVSREPIEPDPRDTARVSLAIYERA